MTLTLALAEKIIDGTRLYAAENNIKPLAVVVLDAGAHPVAFKREDKASLYRFDIAMAKAKGALGMGFNTRDIAEKAKNNPVFFASVTAINGIELALSPTVTFSVLSASVATAVITMNYVRRRVSMPLPRSWRACK